MLQINYVITNSVKTVWFNLKSSADFLQALILVVSASLSGVSSHLAASVVLQSFSVVTISDRRIQTKVCREKETGLTEREREKARLKVHSETCPYMHIRKCALEVIIREREI